MGSLWFVESVGKGFALRISRMSAYLKENMLLIDIKKEKIACFSF